MNIRNMLEAYSNYYPLDILIAKVEFALKFCPEELQFLLPSIELGTDGKILSSLTVVTDKYLCEVNLSSSSFYNFDFLAKTTIFNYRIKAWTHEIKEDEVVKATYEIAEVKMDHGAEGMHSLLSFAGSVGERDIWLKNLSEAIPVRMVLGFSRQVN